VNPEKPEIPDKPDSPDSPEKLKHSNITSSKRTMLEQQMNLDLKVAYDYGREWIRRHEPITVDWLVLLASKVMARTGSAIVWPAITVSTSRQISTNL
jgi:hypothetical protein